MGDFDLDMKEAVEEARRCSKGKIEYLILEAMKNTESGLFERYCHNEFFLMADRDTSERVGIDFSEPEKYCLSRHAIAYFLAVRNVTL